MLRSPAAVAAPRGSGRRRHLETTVYHPAAAGRPAGEREAATPTTTSTRSLYWQATEATKAPAEGEGPTGSLAAPGGDKEDVAAAQGEASEAISAARPARQALRIF